MWRPFTHLGTEAQRGSVPGLRSHLPGGESQYLNQAHSYCCKRMRSHTLGGEVWVGRPGSREGAASFSPL